jgi:hypothetical protein
MTDKRILKIEPKHLLPPSGGRRTGAERRVSSSHGAPFRGEERRSSHSRRLAERDFGNARNVDRDLRVGAQAGGYNTGAVNRAKIATAPVVRRTARPVAKAASRGLLKGFAKKAAVVGLGAAAYGFYKEAKKTFTTIGGDGNE